MDAERHEDISCHAIDVLVAMKHHIDGRVREERSNLTQIDEALKRLYFLLGPDR